MNSQLFAILNPEQLDNLCKRFHLNKDELTPIFTGWHKRIILSNDKVFLFPREEQFQLGIDIETEVYRQFTTIDSFALPKLIERVDDVSISSFQFCITTKLSGQVFSDIIDSMEEVELQDLLLKLTALITKWHNVADQDVPSIIKERFVNKTDTISLKNIHHYLSKRESYQEAINYVLSSLESKDTFSSHEIANLENTVKRISELPFVIVHGDIHEDQILVQGDKSDLEITGILDWESVRYANPVEEFNFGEWGLQIWRWKGSFGIIRRKVWQKYCSLRNIINSNVDDLHTFYLFCELAWMLNQKDKEIISMTGMNYKLSLEEQINELKKYLE